MKKRLYSLVTIILFSTFINGCSDGPEACPENLACPSSAPWWSAGLTCYDSRHDCETVWGKGNCLKCD